MINEKCALSRQEIIVSLKKQHTNKLKNISKERQKNLIAQFAKEVNCIFEEIA